MGKRKPWHEPRIRDDGVEIGTVGLPVPGVIGTAIFFACMVVPIYAVCGVLLLVGRGERTETAAAGLGAGAVVLTVLGVYGVLKRRADLAAKDGPLEPSESSPDTSAR